MKALKTYIQRPPQFMAEQLFTTGDSDRLANLVSRTKRGTVGTRFLLHSGGGVLILVIIFKDGTELKVDRNQWLVSTPDGELKVMNDDEFEAQFVEALPVGTDSPKLLPRSVVDRRD